MVDPRIYHITDEEIKQMNPLQRAAYIESVQKAEYNKGFVTQAKGTLASGKAQLTSAKISKVTSFRNTVDWAKPMIWSAIIVFLVIGPGISAVVTIFKSLNIWMWLGVMALGILIWRNM